MRVIVAAALSVVVGGAAGVGAVVGMTSAAADDVRPAATAGVDPAGPPSVVDYGSR